MIEKLEIKIRIPLKILRLFHLFRFFPVLHPILVINLYLEFKFFKLNYLKLMIYFNLVNFK